MPPSPGPAVAVLFGKKLGPDGLQVADGSVGNYGTRWPSGPSRVAGCVALDFTASVAVELVMIKLVVIDFGEQLLDELVCLHEEWRLVVGDGEADVDLGVVQVEPSSWCGEAVGEEACHEAVEWELGQ